MTTSTENSVSQAAVSGSRQRVIAGAVLIGIGLLGLATQVVQSDVLGLLFLPGLGLIFLIWGIATRNAGLLIPGGILSGIGLGALLVARVVPDSSAPASGGVFLLAFAAGWGLITLLSALFTSQTQWWALIPGGILALIGGALLMGGVGLDLLKLAGQAWPLILIAIGLFVLLRRKSA